MPETINDETFKALCQEVLSRNVPFIFGPYGVALAQRRGRGLIEVDISRKVTVEEIGKILVTREGHPWSYTPQSTVEQIFTDTDVINAVRSYNPTQEIIVFLKWGDQGPTLMNHIGKDNSSGPITS